MLAADNRFKKEDNYEQVKRDGKLYQTEFFGVSVLVRGDKEPPRFGFIISNKISKLATQRNRIKRALSEALRQNIKKVPNGNNIVFLAKRNIANKSTDEIMKEVEKFLSKNYIKK